MVDKSLLARPADVPGDTVLEKELGQHREHVVEVILRATEVARHSRVYSSTTVSSRSLRPS